MSDRDEWLALMGRMGLIPRNLLRDARLGEGYVVDYVWASYSAGETPEMRRNNDLVGYGCWFSSAWFFDADGKFTGTGGAE